MAKRIKINCKKVYDTGSFYEESANQIQNLKKELLEISSNINNAWQGEDSHNFNISFNKHIESLEELINFLGDKSFALKKVSSLHNSIDNNFSNNMKRVDMNE